MSSRAWRRHRELWVTPERLLARPVVYVRPEDLLTPGDENDEGAAAIPVGFAASMRLLRRKHLEQLERGDFRFVEERARFNPLEDWLESVSLPILREYATIIRGLEAAKDMPQSAEKLVGTPVEFPPHHLWPDVRHWSEAVIYLKVVAYWLLTRCESIQQCENAIGHYPIKALLVVIGQLLRCLRPTLVHLSGKTLSHLTSINLLRREVAIGRSCSPCTVEDPSGAIETQEFHGRNAKKAIRYINARILRDMARTPPGVIRNLAKFIPYHTIGIVKDYCRFKYNLESHRLDASGLRSLMQRHLNLRRAVFELVTRLGTSYFTIPERYFQIMWQEESSKLPSVQTSKPKQDVLEMRVHERLWLMQSHCFMNIVTSGCQLDEESTINRSSSSSSSTTVVNRSGVLPSPTVP